MLCKGEVLSSKPSSTKKKKKKVFMLGEQKKKLFRLKEIILFSQSLSTDKSKHSGGVRDVPSAILNVIYLISTTLWDRHCDCPHIISEAQRAGATDQGQSRERATVAPEDGGPRAEPCR
jgi:hypothetical protein